jgi:thiol:disulfide interchange protein
MQPAGARALRADDNDAYAEREAMLSAWEQKSLIDEFPLRTRRFQRSAERSASAPPRPAAAPERRTVTITGHPTPARPRRRSAAQQQLVAQPDRVALWAFLLGLFLVFVAAATASAAPL